MAQIDDRQIHVEGIAQDVDPASVHVAENHERAGLGAELLLEDFHEALAQFCRKVEILQAVLGARHPRLRLIERLAGIDVGVERQYRRRQRGKVLAYRSDIVFGDHLATPISI
jgi:hypothetical protein